MSLPASCTVILLMAIGTLAAASAVAAETPDQEGQSSEDPIVVTGNRRESTQTRKTGQSVTIKPEDASRFETLTYLKRESSVLAPETGRISPSGFVVPMVRGQDVKLTDVYLEDILLQDPYSGLPLVEDLDLRAFGTLEIHQGIPPLDIPGLNPIGTLRYKFRAVAASSVTAGLQLGEPFGQAVWGLGIFHHKYGDDDELDARLYARHHQTDGRYDYYSDEGTPYNTDDDCIRTRENNDQRSNQVVPYIRRRIGPYRYEGFGWAYGATRGLPSLSAVVPSTAREQADGHFVTLKFSRDVAGPTPGAVINLGAEIADGADHRETTDPERLFLGNADASDLSVRSKKLRFLASAVGESAAVYLSYESGATSVQNHLGRRLAVDMDRTSGVGSAGVRVSPAPIWTVELKAAARDHFDVVKGDADTVVLEADRAPQSRHASARALGGSMAFGSEDLGFYVQSAYAARLPGLVEEFGNGSSIQPNAALQPEGIHHRETGAFINGRTGAWRLGVAGYDDQTGNKIVFVPVMADAVKAQNVSKTDIRGIDARGEATIGSSTLYVSVSRLLPYDETGSVKTLLPGIPERVAAVEAEQRLAKATLRWLARYRSKVYRDLGNTVELPGAWINDASIDVRATVIAKDDLRAGLSVRNVFNVMDVPIAATDTQGSSGRTAYSDTSGDPLPGRQWILSVAFSL